MPSLANFDDSVAVTETVEEFLARGGVVETNENGRATTKSMSNPSPEQRGHGYFVKIGSRRANKNITTEQVRMALQQESPTSVITEIYPTRFCIHCKGPSWNFVHDEQRGHSTCKKCGTVNKLFQDNLGTLHLNDDGKANKNNWNITPGMDFNDIETRKNGKRISTAGQKIKSHKRNYWRIRRKIDDIVDRWQFSAVETMANSAKAKLRAYYYSVHAENGNSDDEQSKMPHGAAALAAACFYVSVLEFEKRAGHKTLCTLPAIQEAAQAVRDHKSGRTTRDVTIVKILKYAKILKRVGLCSTYIPHHSAETLRFTAKSSDLQHARMAIFNECTPARFHLPTSGPWGITIGDTNQGVLYIESVKTSGRAFQAGIRKGDYLFQVDKNTVEFSLNPQRFQRWVGSLRKKTEKPVLELTIMRKKKNSV